MENSVQSKSTTPSKTGATHATNYRGKALTQLITIRNTYKDRDPLLSGYVAGIIDAVMAGWPKEMVEETSKR